MKVPAPIYELKGHCSAIYNNTLYVFSKNGFQKIDLEEDGKWKKVPGSPTLVDDAACVLGGDEGNEDAKAFYVVGGTGGDASYSGLQRYSFKDTTWSTLGATSIGMAGRTGHGAGYISSSHKIVVYGGNQPGTTGTSSQSYTIDAVSPYDSQSQLTQGAPPASSPYLMTWDSSNVAMMGGQTSSADVWIFGDSTGWTQSGASLESPTSVSDTTKPIVMDDSGGKVLMTFNMDGSADSVKSYALVNDDGKAQVATSLKKRSLSDYPAYNSSNAPTKKWSDFSLAQQQGMVVVAGGSGDETLAIFNQTSNSWANATELFYGKPQHTLKHNTTTTSFTSSTPTSTSISSSSASVTPTPTSSSTPAAAAGASTSHADLKTILGATLGSVCGVAIILLLLLFLLRRKKQQQIQSGQRPNDSKDRLSFQDQGLAPLTAGAYPMAKSPVPFASMSNDSLAIMSGHATGEKSLKPPSNNGYGLSSKPRDSSPLSPIPSSGLAPSSMYSQSSEAAAIIAGGMAGAGAGAAVGSNKAGDRTTDEGWGKYFEDNKDTSNLGMPADRSTVSSVYTKSDYRGSAWPMTNLTPINFGFLDQPKPLGQVYSGSPTTESSTSLGHNLAIPEAQSARISTASSISLMSEDDPHDTAWTGAHKQSWLGRPPSSNYSTSFYNSSTRDLQNTGSGYFPDMDNRQSMGHGRRSSVIIPDDIDELRATGRNANVNSDMSWLNIHADR
ncbi:hypothetical protein N7533_010913 [Penicillium manginii]|jgi:hypothetical protein|uniref:uncharacterized protein n=1 Tax=Penicillium manginii TaxID=203109 RepID=UPI002548C9B8|nr:uncharacterized protein N7533_010913 [Penicillium manginii]KAJ5741504.1 hypothetical protein N7533_010913 [Penicillium manginii]